MKQETTKDRVKVLLEELQITQKAFEDAVGLANGWCNKVGFNIREDVLRRISKAYPELNLAAYWHRRNVHIEIIGCWYLWHPIFA